MRKNRPVTQPQRPRTKPQGVVGVSTLTVQNAVASEYSGSSKDIFDEGDNVQTKVVSIGSRRYEYVPFGADDLLPFEIIKKVGNNLVLAQNQLFNMLSCYGQGVRFFDKETLEKTKNAEIEDFCFRNQLNKQYMEQILDMKYFYFSVTVIILNNQGDKIVRMVSKEACFTRLEKADEEGKIHHIFYGNWKKSSGQNRTIECIPLLDLNDPWGDLQVRMGREPDPTMGEKRKPTRDRKFAIITRFPTPGFQYYPVPFWTSALRDAWYDIYMMIGIGKRAKIRNSASPRYQVEISNEYWEQLCESEGIVDDKERKERIAQGKREIENFIMGVENAGKTWITPYYYDQAQGKEVHYVQVTPIGANIKEGGDWSDDVQEASNTLCYGTNVHPNLVGATPGKSQMNNSGTDKRELFDLKQSIETAFHDILLYPYKLLCRYNGWTDVDVDVPFIQLTTLDKNTEKQEVTTTDNGNGTDGTQNN